MPTNETCNCLFGATLSHLTPTSPNNRCQGLTPVARICWCISSFRSVKHRGMGTDGCTKCWKETVTQSTLSTCNVTILNASLVKVSSTLCCPPHGALFISCNMVHLPSLQDEPLGMITPRPPQLSHVASRYCINGLVAG